MTTLYYHPLSNHSRLVRLTAQLSGVELDEKVVDLFAGDNRRPAFLELNPNGQVPVLDDGGFVLWESTAIAQYLAAPELWSEDARERADICRWQCWALAHFDPTTRVFPYERLFKPLKAEPPDDGALAVAAAELARLGDVLEGALAGRRFLVGDRLTLADLSVAVALGYAEAAAIPLARWPHLRRWLGSIAELDAWRRTAPQMP